MNYKTCFTCGKSLPATPEYFNRDSQKSDGFRPSCKECRSAKRKERYANDEELRINNRKRAAEWVAGNLERHKTNGRQNYLKNRERRIEYARRWCKDNPEKYSENIKRRWLREKYDPVAIQKRNARTRNRRARIKGNGGSHTADDIQERIEEQGYMCFYCSYPLEDDYHVDHYYPLSKGGSNGAENIVIACPSCNKSKSDKDPHEFMSLIGKNLYSNIELVT